MPRFITNVALSIKGERVEKGTEVEIADEAVASFDPADLTPVDAVVEEAPAPEEEVPVEEMTLAELKEKAKALGLSASGSKADLQERIGLHLAGTADTEPADGEEGDPDEDEEEDDLGVSVGEDPESDTDDDEEEDDIISE